jgi:hypothetical protein
VPVLLLENYLRFLLLGLVWLFFNKAALAGQQDPGIEDIEKLSRKKKKTLSEKAQIMMQKMVTSLGFWGILILASVDYDFLYRYHSH